MQRGLVSKGLPQAPGAPEGQSWDLHVRLTGQSQSFSLTHLASVSSGDGQPSLVWKATVLRPSGLFESLVPCGTHSLGSCLSHFLYEENLFLSGPEAEALCGERKQRGLQPCLPCGGDRGLG